MLLECGCDASDQSEQVRKSIESWGATVDIVADQWAQHRVPRTYIGQIVKAAEKSLDEDEKRLTKNSANSEGRRQVQRRLVELRRRLHELSSAVERGEPKSARMPSRPPGQQPGTEGAGGRL